MLSVAKEHLLERAETPEEKARVENFVFVYGQELSPTNYAVCQADLLIKNDRHATVHLGNSLIPHDPHSKEPGDQWPEPKWRFHRMLSNPPFGVTWGGKDGYEREARKLEKTRYSFAAFAAFAAFAPFAAFAAFAVFASFAPKGLHPSAQGCGSAATLGYRKQCHQPRRGCVERRNLCRNHCHPSIFIWSSRPRIANHFCAIRTCDRKCTLIWVAFRKHWNARR